MTLKQCIRLQNVKNRASYLKKCVIQRKGLFYRPYDHGAFHSKCGTQEKKLFCFCTDLDKFRCADVPWVDTVYIGFYDYGYSGQSG